MIHVLLGSIYSINELTDLSLEEFGGIVVEGFQEIGAFYNATLNLTSISASKFYFSDISYNDFVDKQIMFIAYLDESFINKYVGYGTLKFNDSSKIINDSLIIENISSICFKC